jgi:type II secretory pathway pseudopilin PulG
MNHKSNTGFTLIELLLYVGIVAIVITGAILFAWDVIYGRIKSQTQQEVSQNLRLATKRIAYEIRNASGINSVSGSTLSLAMSDTNRNPTVFDLSGGQVRIGYGSSGSCPTTSPCTLTSNEVTVSTLTFTNRSSGTDSYNVQFDITIESTADRQEWQITQSYTSSVEVRSN